MIIWRESNKREKKKTAIEIPVKKNRARCESKQRSPWDWKTLELYESIINEVGEKQMNELRIKMRMQISHIGPKWLMSGETRPYASWT